MPPFHLCMHIFEILSSSSSSAQSVLFVWLLIRIKTEMLLVLSEGSREQLMPDSYSREETKNEKIDCTDDRRGDHNDDRSQLLPNRRRGS